MKSIIAVLGVLLLLVSCSGKKEVKKEVFDPEEGLKKASKLIEDEEFDKARQLLLEIKHRDTTQKYSPIAQLKIAESYMKEEDLDSAIHEYRRFLRIYPDHPQAPFAQYQIAMIYFQQIEGPDKGAAGARKALKEFQRLLRDYPRNPYREIAKLRIRQCRNLIAEYEFLVGRFYYKKGAYNAAVGRFNEIITNFPDYRKLPEVMYFMAMAYKNIGNTELAKKYIEELVSKFPDSKPAHQAKNLKFGEEKR
jgi:outer membrane protein assembly factor BamD